MGIVTPDRLDSIVVGTMLPLFSLPSDPSYMEEYNLYQLTLWLDGKITYNEMYRNIKIEDED